MPDKTIVTVRPFTEPDGNAWDRFVLGHEEATFFHLSPWLTLCEEVHGHKGHYLLAEQNGEIQGILPLVEQRSLLFGHALISTPFCVYGGVVARRPEAAKALGEKAQALAARLGVDHLECRNRRSQHPEWLQKSLYFRFGKPMEPTPEENLAAIPRKQRAEVRRGIRAGLALQVDEDVERCYQVYSESVRNLGTPVFSQRHFRMLKALFGEACEATTVVHDGRPVNAVLSFYFRDQVLPYYGGGIYDARRLGGNAFMYWALMSRALERGAAYFDFGRSKHGTGSYDFKRYYGFEPQPLHYEFHLQKATELPDINPLNPKYQTCIRLWKRLPLKVSQSVGPWLARYLG